MFPVVDAARRLSLPTVWCIRESVSWPMAFSEWPAEVRNTALEVFTAPYRVVFDSRACRAEFESLNSHHNFTVIHTGIHREMVAGRRSRATARQSLDVASADVVVVLVGTVCERKGQADLVNALSQVRRETARTLRCFIVGDRPGEYSEYLKALIASLSEHLAARISVVPETSDVGMYLSAADIFVCTSRVESYPRVTLEAMAFCLPIISTGVFGLSEQLVDGRNATLYHPGDAAALARALDALVGNASRRAEMAAEAANVFAAVPGFDEMVEAYRSILQEAAVSSR
jgi:glycosyltransferase involved in cell wall biosynthesis